jgi:hypothetical protein
VGVGDFAGRAQERSEIARHLAARRIPLGRVAPKRLADDALKSFSPARISQSTTPTLKTSVCALGCAS